MEEENKESSGNQAGPSSTPPETELGLQETIQSGEKILNGAQNDDQLQRLKDTAQYSDNEIKTEKQRDKGGSAM